MNKGAMLTAAAAILSLTLAACGKTETPAAPQGALAVETPATPAPQPVTPDVAQAAEKAAAVAAAPTRESIMDRQAALQKFREAQKRALEHSKASR